MKKLIKAFKNLSQNQIERLMIMLKTKPSKDGDQEIISSILSFTGLDLLLSDLKGDELKILNTVYWEKDGITFGEIEKKEGINPERIEEIVKGLASKLLVYVLKNRQKLHNRLDKLFIIPEFRDFLNPLKEETIADYYQSIKNKLENLFVPETDLFKEIQSSSPMHKVARFLFKSGGIATLSELPRIIPHRYVERVLVRMQGGGIINIYHDLKSAFKTYIILNEDAFVSMSQRDNQRSDADQNININNQYMFLLNLLTVYDTVSASGLFLTRQREFRKIDCVRLSESMHRIYDTRGAEIPPAEISQLCLYIFYILKAVSIKKDTVTISLKDIRDYLDDPAEMLFHIINKIQNDYVEDTLFLAPFAIPLHKDILSIVKTVQKVRESHYSYLRITRILKPLSELKEREFKNITDLRRDNKSRFNAGMRFLCIIGVIEIANGNVRLSDVGRDMASRILKGKSVKGQNTGEAAESGKIYINPDFTLMIPRKEIPSDALYHILTRTEIIKDDVILNARISKASILAAYKRGMPISVFLSNLRKYSKIGIPQNLEFMINEWSAQTIKLDFQDVVLLRTTHPAFIDELLYGELKTVVIHRLTPEYAVIDRRYLDRILKQAKKSDAVIRLFEEET